MRHDQSRAKIQRALHLAPGTIVGTEFSDGLFAFFVTADPPRANIRTSESDNALRWRKWQEKSHEADRRIEKRMKILFFVVAGVFLALTLWVVFRPTSLPQVDHSLGKVARAWGEDYTLCATCK